VEGGEFNEASDGPGPDEREEKAGKAEEPEKPEAKESEHQPAATPPVVGSIPPQYQEQAAEEQTGHHHMMATQDHETPLLEPPHQGKHAVLWITLAVIILLATGAGFAWWFLIATA
jgi:hypothetical protein